MSELFNPIVVLKSEKNVEQTSHKTVNNNEEGLFGTTSFGSMGANIFDEIIENQNNKMRKLANPPKTTTRQKVNSEVPDDKPKKTRKPKAETSNSTAEEPEIVEEKDPRADVDFYVKRFARPLSRVVDIIEELDDKKSLLEDEIKNIRDKSGASRNGAILEYISNSEKNVIDILKAKLQAVKEESSILNTVSNLETKASKDSAVANSGQNEQKIVSNLYNKLVNNNEMDYNINSVYDNFMITATPNDLGNEDTADILLSSRFSDLKGTGEITETNADLNLKYANRSIEMYVIKTESTQDWRFAAFDVESNEELYDYVKPTVVGTMRFDTDKMLAYDQLIKYKLLLVPDVVQGYEEVNYLNNFNNNDDDSSNDTYYGYY